MEILLRILVSALFGALIGYLANRLAIWMLFHPIKEYRIGPFKIQGVIPRMKNELINRFGEIIEREVLNYSDIVGEIKNVIKRETERYLDTHIPKFLGDIGDKITRLIADGLSNLISNYIGMLSDKISIREVVIRKFKDLDVGELSKTVNKAIGKELRYISINDAILGFIIGALEPIIWMYIM